MEMKTLTRLRKADPKAEGRIRAQVLVILLKLINHPPTWREIAVEIDYSVFPEEGRTPKTRDLPAGVVLRAVIGKLADEGVIHEKWHGEEIWPRYELAA